MARSGEELSVRARKILGLQLAATLLVSFGLYLWQGVLEGQSALFGGFISIASTLLLSRGVKQASEVASTDRGKSMRILYLGAAQRFFLVIAAFAFGLAVLHLDPLSMFAGFALAQLSYFLSIRDLTQTKNGG